VLINLSNFAQNFQPLYWVNYAGHFLSQNFLQCTVGTRSDTHEPPGTFRNFIKLIEALIGPSGINKNAQEGILL
jgi:hypothetical protein